MGNSETLEAIALHKSYLSKSDGKLHLCAIRNCQLYQLSDILQKANRLEEAEFTHEELLVEANALCLTCQECDYEVIVWINQMKADLLIELCRFEEAFDVLAANEILLNNAGDVSSCYLQKNVLLLARCYRDSLRLESAEACAHKLLALPDKDCSVCRLSAMSILAAKAMVLGHTDEAVKWLSEAKEGVMREHSDGKGLRKWIALEAANLYHGRAHYKEAIVPLDEVLNSLDRGSDNEEIILVLCAKAAVLADYGSIIEAQEISDYLEELVKGSCVNALTIARVLLTRGQVAFASEDYDIALGFYGAVEEKFVRSYRHPHLVVVELKEAKARALGILARYDEAFVLLKECYELRSRIYGKEHPILHVPLLFRAELQIRLESFEHAEDELESCVELLSPHCLPTHPWLLRVRLEQGLFLEKSNHPRMAIQILAKTLEGLKSVFGFEHPQVIDALTAISRCHLALNNTNKATPAARDAYEASLAFLHQTNKKVVTAKALMEHCEQMLV